MRKIIICDLDGTLANSEEVRHLLPNYDLFYTACCYVSVNEAVLATLKGMYNKGQGPEIWIVSGRSDRVRAGTIAWLAAHDVPCNNLIMRKHGDYTKDDVLKKSWLTSGRIPKERILFCLDDRDRVVKMWRDEGLSAFQVNYGNF